MQELLRNSDALNVVQYFLNEADTFDPTVLTIDAMTAAEILWLEDALTNVDGTGLNPNMMIWGKDLWLIDHGASFYFHHSGKDPRMAAEDPFPYIKNHVFLPYADKLEEADKLMRQAITPRTLSKIVDLIPEEWLSVEGSDNSPEDLRENYRIFLTERLKKSDVFVKEAIKINKNSKS